jgi:ferredoxin-NADP reductase
MRISQDWQTATVRSSTPLSPTVRELQLVPDAGCSRPAPGSHLPVRLTTADGRVLTRQYSLLGRSDDGLAWRIAVKRCSPSRGGSAAMHALAAGDVLQVLPPQNHFELSVRAPQHLLVAGGIGITPILGMAQALVARGADVRLLYAVRSADERVYADTLQALLGERLQTFVSSQGQRLDITAEVARLQPDAQLLLCGPAGLTRAAQAAWHAAGRPAHRLRFETFGAVATEAEPFWVDLPRHHPPLPRRPCRQLPAPGVPAGGARAGRQEGDISAEQLRAVEDKAITEIVKFQAGRGPAEHHRRRVPPHLLPHRLPRAAGWREDRHPGHDESPTAPRNWRRR